MDDWLYWIGVGGFVVALLILGRRFQPLRVLLSGGLVLAGLYLLAGPGKAGTAGFWLIVIGGTWFAEEIRELFMGEG